MTAASIDRLLLLAGVAADQQDKARSWLQSALQGWQTEGRIERPTPAKHNEPLEAVEIAAKDLLEALRKLHDHPHAFDTFWNCRRDPSDEIGIFGPVGADEGSDLKRTPIIHTIEAVASAAKGAKDTRTSRLRDTRKQNVVNLARGFFVRFSPLPLTDKAKGPFARFAHAFYEVATGVKVNSLECQIERAVKEQLARQE